MKNRSGQTVLKQVFDMYADESISDEQVQRIMAPVIQMIREGRFNRSKRVLLLNGFYKSDKTYNMGDN